MSLKWQWKKVEGCVGRRLLTVTQSLTFESNHNIVNWTRWAVVFTRAAAAIVAHQALTPRVSRNYCSSRVISLPRYLRTSEPFRTFDEIASRKVENPAATAAGLLAEYSFRREIQIQQTSRQSLGKHFEEPGRHCCKLLYYRPFVSK